MIFHLLWWGLRITVRLQSQLTQSATEEGNENGSHYGFGNRDARKSDA